MIQFILYAPFILFAVGTLVYIGFQVKQDRLRMHRSAQYERWLQDLKGQGPDAIQAQMPHILGKLHNPDYRGPWESLKP